MYHQLKITILGNSQVGKTTFIDQVQGEQSKKIKSKVQIDIDKRNIKLFVLGQQYELIITDVKGAGPHLDKNYNNMQVLTSKTDICLIFFDISNKQSFDDVRRWLNFAKQEIKPKPKNIVLIANKIDKQATTVNLKSIFHFCEINQLQVFFSTSDMNDRYCRSILEDIIIQHQSKLEIQWLKEKKQEDIKKPNLFSRIFRSNSNNQGLGKQDEKQKQKEKNREFNIVKKLQEIKRAEKNAIKQMEARSFDVINKIKEKILKVYQQCFRQSLISCISNNNQNQNQEDKLQDYQLYLNKFEQKIQIHRKQNSNLMQRIRELSLDHQQQLTSLKKSNQQLTKIKLVFQNKSNTLNEQLKQQIKQKESLIKQLSRNIEKINRLENKIEQLQNIRRSYESSKIQVLDENNKYMDMIGKLEKQNKQLIKAKQLIDKQYLINKQQRQQLQKQLQMKSSTLFKFQRRIAFEESIIMKKFQESSSTDLYPQIVASLANYSNINQKNRVKFRLSKIYQSNLCYSANVHAYLGQKKNSNLFYVLQFQKSVMLIYTPEPLVQKGKGFQGKFIICTKNSNSNPNSKQPHNQIQAKFSNPPSHTKKPQVLNIQTAKNIQFWQYDPISLIFGRRQLVIRFTRQACMLWINKKLKKESMFLGKINNLVDKLDVQLDQNNYVAIKMLEIFNLQFYQ